MHSAQKEAPITYLLFKVKSSNDAKYEMTPNFTYSFEMMTVLEQENEILNFNLETND